MVVAGMYRRTPSPTHDSPPHSPGSPPGSAAPNPHAWLETLPHAQLVDLVATMISKPPAAAARVRTPPPAEQEVSRWCFPARNLPDQSALRALVQSRTSAPISLFLNHVHSRYCIDVIEYVIARLCRITWHSFSVTSSHSDQSQSVVMRRLFVRELSFHTTNASLKSFFSQYGPVEDGMHRFSRSFPCPRLLIDRLWG